MKINDAKYYESNTETAGDAQFDPTQNPEIVANTSNGNETVIHASNGNFEQKILSKRTIPVVVPTINPRIDQRVAPILVVPKTILVPATKEVISNAASGGT